MKKIWEYITPLIICFLCSVIIGVKYFLMPSEEGWGQLFALIIWVFFSFPILVANVIINWATNTKHNKRVAQGIVTILFILAALIYVIKMRP